MDFEDFKSMFWLFLFMVMMLGLYALEKWVLKLGT